MKYRKTCLKRPLSKRPKIGFQDQLSLNAILFIAECSNALLTFIKIPFVIKIFVLSIFELPLYKGFTVLNLLNEMRKRDKMRGLLSILSLFCNEFNNFQ